MFVHFYVYALGFLVCSGPMVFCRLAHAAQANSTHVSTCVGKRVSPSCHHPSTKGSPICCTAVATTRGCGGLCKVCWAYWARKDGARCIGAWERLWAPVRRLGEREGVHSSSGRNHIKAGQQTHPARKAQYSTTQQHAVLAP